MKASLKPKESLYGFARDMSVRPARLSHRVDHFEIRIQRDFDFLWRQSSVCKSYEFYLSIETVRGKMSLNTIPSEYLGTPALPFFLLSPVLVPAGSFIRLRVYNVISPGRKWNKIQIAFMGLKITPPGHLDAIKL